MTSDQPEDDEPVTLDELSDYLAGVELPPAEEERLLTRIASDPDAANKMSKLRAIDAKVAAALGLEGAPPRPDEAPGPMSDDRAARFQAALRRLAQRRAELGHDDEGSPRPAGGDDSPPA